MTMSTAEFRAGLRALILSPKVIDRWILILETGKPSERRAALKLAEQYLLVLPPDLQAAVLAARGTVSQVVKNVKPSFQSSTKKVVPKTTVNP